MSADTTSSPFHTEPTTIDNDDDDDDDARGSTLENARTQDTRRAPRSIPSVRVLHERQHEAIKEHKEQHHVEAARAVRACERQRASAEPSARPTRA